MWLFFSEEKRAKKKIQKNCRLYRKRIIRKLLGEKMIRCFSTAQGNIIFISRAKKGKRKTCFARECLNGDDKKHFTGEGKQHHFFLDKPQKG
jgi:hypothetical protein